MIETTMSFWRAFRGCHELNNLRYNEELVPKERDEALLTGTLVHDALEIFHKSDDIGNALHYLSEMAQFEEGTKYEEWVLKAEELVLAYHRRWAEEPLEFATVDGRKAVELVFRNLPIENPETGAASRTFTLSGKLDGIITFSEAPQEHWVLERKTATTIDANYLERLWVDFQNHLYVHAARKVWDLNVVGVLYDVCQKPMIRRQEPESDEEFAVRKEQLLAKSKSGRTSATQRIGESKLDFQERLHDWYGDPVKPERFHRQRLIVSMDDVKALQLDLWDLTQQYIESRRRGIFSRNTDYCFHWNKPCPYWQACRSKRDPFTMETLYKKEAPNCELES